MKPCLQSEINFYESALAHPKFAVYIPTCYGVLSLPRAAPEAAPTTQLDPDAIKEFLTNLHAPLQPYPDINTTKIQTDRAIALENVAHGFQKPNILDVKLGSRLWADDATPAKRQKLEKVASETISGPLGFRVAGMRIWQGSDSNHQTKDSADPHILLEADNYKVSRKDYGQAMKPETVKEGFHAYFFVEQAGVTPRLAKHVIRRFLQDLRGLRDVLEEEESRMYSASLLLVYEGDGKTLEANLNAEEATIEHASQSSPLDGLGPGTNALTADNSNPHLSTGPNIDSQPVTEANDDDEEEDEEDDEEDDDGPPPPQIHAVKIIDFAHAAWTPGLGRDENVLKGVRNVIAALEELAS